MGKTGVLKQETAAELIKRKLKKKESKGNPYVGKGNEAGKATGKGSSGRKWVNGGSEKRKWERNLQEFWDRKLRHEANGGKPPSKKRDRRTRS